MKSIKLFALAAMASLAACNNAPEGNKTSETDSAVTERNKEAREDSLKMAEAKALQAAFSFQIQADSETPPVASKAGADAADDPAVWINSENPEKSLILGTNKKEGLYAYDLQGKEVSYIKAGKINNVDLRDGFKYKGKDVVLVAASNRSLNAVSLFYIDKDSLILSDTVANIPSTVDDVYGLCMYHDRKADDFYVIVNGKDGVFEQWKIFCKKEGGPTYELSRTFKVASQPEGVAADDETDMIYLGVEEDAVYKLSANPADTATMQKVADSDKTSSHISYDIEGMEVFKYKGETYLMVSVQGNFSYAVYKVGETDEYIGTFTVTDGATDGAEETDGLDVVATDALPDFPGGIIVLQDGFNYDGEILVNQNFKYIALQKIENLLNGAK